MQQHHLWPVQDEQGGDALIEGTYRYWLRRWWGPGDETLLWILLNPSVADGQVEDPTVRRVITFSRREGYNRAEIVNLFALRATNPAELRRAANPIGPGNDDYLRQAVAHASSIIVAWGDHGSLFERNTAVFSMLKEVASCPLLCFGCTKRGAPRHPLYLLATAPLQLYVQ